MSPGADRCATHLSASVKNFNNKVSMNTPRSLQAMRYSLLNAAKLPFKVSTQMDRSRSGPATLRRLFTDSHLVAGDKVVRRWSPVRSPSPINRPDTTNWLVFCSLLYYTVRMQRLCRSVLSTELSCSLMYGRLCADLEQGDICQLADYLIPFHLNLITLYSPLLLQILLLLSLSTCNFGLN